MDRPDSNMLTLEMIADEEQYPTPQPSPLRYGYDMRVEDMLATRHDGYPFGSANG